MTSRSNAARLAFRHIHGSIDTTLRSRLPIHTIPPPLSLRIHTCPSFAFTPARPLHSQVCHLARLKAFPTAEEMQAAAAAATEAAAEGGAAEQAPNTAVVAGAETVSVVTGGLWIASDRCWPLLVPVACHLLAVASFVSDRCF